MSTLRLTSAAAALGLVLSACTTDQALAPDTAAGVSPLAAVWGPETPPFNLQAVLRDPSGGAGVFADIKTFSALGAYGCGVVAALTAQNTQAVTAYALSPVSEALRAAGATHVRTGGRESELVGLLDSVVGNSRQLLIFVVTAAGLVLVIEPAAGPEVCSQWSVDLGDGRRLTASDRQPNRCPSGRVPAVRVSAHRARRPAFRRRAFLPAVSRHVDVARS